MNKKTRSPSRSTFLMRCVRIKFTDCPNAALYEHLSGRRTLDLIAFRRLSSPSLFGL